MVDGVMGAPHDSQLISLLESRLFVTILLQLGLLQVHRVSLNGKTGEIGVPLVLIYFRPCIPSP